MADEEEGSLGQELQVLQSIYLEELEVCQQDRLELRITLHPATGDDAESQYVRLTLLLRVPPQYPDVPPEISISNPRGLCDEQLHSITEALRSAAAQAVGSPVLYELIEKGKEMLTDSNIPRGHCVICLYGFQEGDFLTKTSCFHHFHSHCLGRYSKHCLEQRPPQEEEPPSVLCPVCRESLACDPDKLQEAPPPDRTEESYVPDVGTVQREEELRHIYQKQLANGGIIDVEAEKNRYFISIQQTPTADQTPSMPEENPESAPPDNGPALVEECAHPPLTSKHPQEAQAGAANHRARTQPAMSRPMYRGHYGGPHWRGGRGRTDTRRVWRDEAGHRDFQPHTRGKGKPRGGHGNGPVRGGHGNGPMRGSYGNGPMRGSHGNGPVQAPLQDGHDNSAEEKDAL